MKQDQVMPDQGKRAKKVKEAELAGDEQSSQEPAIAAGTLDDRMISALHAAAEKKALELTALDLRDVASFTDYFLIASGTNSRQVQAIADSIEENLKKQGTRPARIEGYGTAEWVLLDYGDFIFHVFEEKARRFYDLERLWRDAARVAIPEDLVSRDDVDSSLRRES